MLVGQQLGPFAIDKELGAGAMGAVYRGRYLKTGQLVAVKVMAPGAGGARDNAADRFEREAEILKQLNHPNIVRLFGVGKHKGTRYFAMEYIEGESLDRVMARRGRVTWEEVVALGRQLCAALQHAHEKGIVHRDLKPSNLMLLPDGTLKLTDFGIAKDLDLTQLTNANCTVGTAAYMSPEQCKGERDLTHKSDLYSLGVLFYELITGKKPFTADNAMDLFMQHVQGEFVRPARVVLDVPVWLDTLICQLLEKKPEQRPRDAALVAGVLGSIQEKVEAQQSAGVDAARSRIIDRPQRQGQAGRHADDTEKEVARTLLGGKAKARRRPKKKPWYRRVWLQAAGLGALLLGVVGVLVLVLRPPSADKLYHQAKRLMDLPGVEDHEKARAGPIKEYLAHYRDRPGPQTEDVQRWSDQVDREECEQLLQKYQKKRNSPLPFQAQSPVEEQAFKAADAEEAGDLAEAGKRWEAIVREQGRYRWGLLAEQHLKDLGDVDAEEGRLRNLLDGVRKFRREPQVKGLELQAFTAARYEHFGDLFRARQRFEDLRKEAGQKPEDRPWYLLATRKVRDLKEKLRGQEDKEEERRRRVEEALARARDPEANLLDAVATCLTVLALYEGDAGLEPQVDEARQLLAKLPQGVKPS
jgi:serine/threonine-protein kinase